MNARILAPVTVLLGALLWSGCVQTIHMGKIPVVVVSAERSEPAIAHLKQLGICAHLMKPFTPEQVLETITRVLEEAAARSHS